MLTEQELFDKVVEHATKSEISRYKKVGYCMYRSHAGKSYCYKMATNPTS